MPSLHKWIFRALPALSGLGFLSLLGGCLGAGQSVEAPPDRLSYAAAITNTTFSDATGRIQIRVKTCDPTPANFTNCAYCNIEENDWALIGGGAQILGEANPGAMLQASFPSPNSFNNVNSFGCTGPANPMPFAFKSTWVARASGANHQLQAYVIGLRLKGNDGIWFRPYVSEGRDNVTNTVNPPSLAEVETPQNYPGAFGYLIGGGASILRNIDITLATNAYLVGSRPVDGTNGRAWRASARSTSTFSGTGDALKSYALFMEPCQAQMSPKCLTYPEIRSVTAASTSGYGTAGLFIPQFKVSSGPGGFAFGGSRFLADLLPFNGSNQGFTVRSRAYTTSSGQTIGSALVFGLPFDIYTVVYNHSNKCMGVLNARTDATAPVAQQTCTFGNQPSNARFAMVLQPGGYLALRFEHSGLCMDISGGSQNNGAAAIQYPCTYTDNQLVQLINNGPGVHTFKFKHSGKCLDVTGASTADGARFIQYTCNGQANQAFHFDD